MLNINTNMKMPSGWHCGGALLHLRYGSLVGGLRLILWQQWKISIRELWKILMFVSCVALSGRTPSTPCAGAPWRALSGMPWRSHGLSRTWGRSPTPVKSRFFISWTTTPSCNGWSFLWPFGEPGTVEMKSLITNRRHQSKVHEDYSYIESLLCIKQQPQGDMMKWKMVVSMCHTWSSNRWIIPALHRTSMGKTTSGIDET